MKASAQRSKRSRWLPASKTKQTELALAYARDGYALIDAVYDASTPDWIRQLEAVQVLRIVLLQNYTRNVTSDGKEVVKRREADGDGLRPGRLRLTSPYDTDARWGVKKGTFWNGYKVQCDMRSQCAVRRVESREVRDLPAGLLQQPGGSWAQSDPGGAGEGRSSADNDGTARDCQTSWVRQARPEGTREESVVKLCRRVGELPARIWWTWVFI